MADRVQVKSNPNILNNNVGGKLISHNTAQINATTQTQLNAWLPWPTWLKHSHKTWRREAESLQEDKDVASRCQERSSPEPSGAVPPMFPSEGGEGEMITRYWAEGKGEVGVVCR